MKAWVRRRDYNMAGPAVAAAYRAARASAGHEDRPRQSTPVDRCSSCASFLDDVKQQQPSAKVFDGLGGHARLRLSAAHPFQELGE